MALSAKTVAAMATAALGTATMVAAPAARASTIGPLFLYRHNAGENRNCTGKNRELQNDGDVNIARYIYELGPIYSSVHGDIQTVHRKEWSATRAVKQLWCYNGSYYNEYFAANGFTRTVYQYWLCSNGVGFGFCNVFEGSKATAWKAI